MSEPLLVAILLTPVTVVLIAGIRPLARRLPAQTARPWIQAATYALLAATAAYLWGAWHLFAWNISDVCSIRSGTAYDPVYDQVTLWPLSRRCNASFDLVPGYVNPAVAVLLAAAVLSVAAVTGVASANRRRPPSSPG